ncbi:hypothetical protein QV06_00530 [Gallibacterium genomosp. 3]|uniref:Uncharacterized protein n=1 Tax=Gallibacterium genomosp. 3 TaxID=505345 RepID=A0A1A7PTM1_9PAST|nr:hypothetical protein [Gallibacterium genomosp. 3]OBX05923.1 hypothetical protein QV06_00530 [Gallibacterium genomosp. 3]
MCNQQNKLSDWLAHSMSENDLNVAESIFKAIDKFGLEGAKAEVAFERARRNLWLAYQRKAELCTNKEE